MNMTMKKLDAIKQRLDNCIIKPDVGLIWDRYNAEFIAHAPEDIKLLLEVVEGVMEAPGFKLALEAKLKVKPRYRQLLDALTKLEEEE